MPLTSAQLGSAIRRLRTEQELTIETLALDAGIHWTYLTGIERGRRNPSLKVIVAIAGALDVRVYELMKEAERTCEGDEAGSDT